MPFQLNGRNCSVASDGAPGPWRSESGFCVGYALHSVELLGGVAAIAVAWPRGALVGYFVGALLHGTHCMKKFRSLL